MGRGSSKAGNPTGGVTAAQRRTIDRIANKTRNLKNEQERIVNEDGEIVAEARGGRGEVAMTVGTKREYMNGAVGIHNHPDNGGGGMGGTFSDADLNDFGYGAREIVVAAPEGNYILTNTRYGYPDQYEGWVDMRDASRAAGVFDVSDTLGFSEINRRARQNPTVQRLTQRSNSIAEEWSRQRSAGASQSVLDGLVAQSDAIGKELSQATRLARSQVVLTPAHEWYTQNASRYGFNYRFIPKGANVYNQR